MLSVGGGGGARVRQKRGDCICRIVSCTHARVRAFALARVAEPRVRKTYGSTAAHCVFSRAAWLCAQTRRGGGSEEGKDYTEGEEGRAVSFLQHTLRHQTRGKTERGE